LGLDKIRSINQVEEIGCRRCELKIEQPGIVKNGICYTEVAASECRLLGYA